MMTHESWPHLAAALADHLRTSGATTHPGLLAAFAEVPRHVFVPAVIDGRRSISAEDPTWLPTIYRDTALLTRTAATLDRQQLPASSSSQPTIMAVMLDLLAIEPGMRVLEIGTGTGYHAALLAHQLGERNVASVDIDPELVATARSRLAEIGLRPTLVAGDGSAGVPDAGPFDRIIATCAVGHVPPAWITQLAPGGRIVAPLNGQAGPLMVLDKTAADEVTGRFDGRPARFMPLRPAAGDPLAIRETTGFQASGMAHTGVTMLDPMTVAEAPNSLVLFCQLHASGLRITTATGDGGGSVLVHTHGALAEVHCTPIAERRWSTSQRGDHRLWDVLEKAVNTWGELGQPSVDRFGITALDRIDRQYVWLDDPAGPYSWPLAA